MQELTRTRSELAHTDQLTGLPNRRGFDDAATVTLRSAHEADLPAVVFMCDIGFTVSHGEIELSKIMRIADQALYAAKHGGRNRVARADTLSLAA